MNSNISYGTYIKNRRKELGLSQYDVSEILLTSTQALSQYENDKVSINLAILGSFCKVLDVDVKHFLTKTVGKDKNLVDTNTFDANKFASTLMSFRTSRNLSQKDLATALEVSNNKISKWELGNSLPTLEEFLRIADYYKVDPDELYFSTIDSFLSPEIEVVKVKSKTKKAKVIFMTSIISIAVILGITLPLALRPVPPQSGENNGNNNDPLPPVIETKTYHVTILYEGLEISNKVIDINEGEKIPLLSLNIPIEYQEDYFVKEYLVDGETFDVEQGIYSDLTIKIVVEKKKQEAPTYFNVTFYDVDKITPLGNTQKVKKGDSASAPSIDLLERVSGYEFEKWDKDFSSVQMDMDVFPVLKPYTTILHFVSETEKIEDFINYTHDRFLELPTSKKDGYIFDGWILNTGEKFTKDTFLEKEMTLYTNFVLKKDYKITFKGFNDAPLVMANEGETIKYNSLPKILLKNETIKYFIYNGQIIDSDFVFSYNHDIELVPFFKEIFECNKISEYSVEILSIHSANEEVNVPRKIDIDGKKYEYVAFKKGTLDLPRAKKITFDCHYKTKFFNGFIKNAPLLEEISFPTSTREELDRALFFEKNCLSNITTLKSIEFGIARDFNGNLFSVMNLGNKFNDNFKLKLLDASPFNGSLSKGFNYFPKDTDSLEIYKKITAISFKEEGDFNFITNTFELFPNLKQIDILEGISKFECLNFNIKEVIFYASSSLKEINFLFDGALNTKDNLINKIKFVSNSDLKITGELYAKEIDFSEVKEIIFNNQSTIYITEKVSFPNSVSYLKESDFDTLIYNINKDKKVDIYFKDMKPLSLTETDTFKPFKGVNDGLTKDLFNFYII